MKRILAAMMLLVLMLCAPCAMAKEMTLKAVKPDGTEFEVTSDLLSGETDTQVELNGGFYVLSGTRNRPLTLIVDENVTLWLYDAVFLSAGNERGFNIRANSESDNGKSVTLKLKGTNSMEAADKQHALYAAVPVTIEEAAGGGSLSVEGAEFGDALTLKTENVTFIKPKTEDKYALNVYGNLTCVGDFGVRYRNNPNDPWKEAGNIVSHPYAEIVNYVEVTIEGLAGPLRILSGLRVMDQVSWENLKRIEKNAPDGYLFNGILMQNGKPVEFAAGTEMKLTPHYEKGVTVTLLADDHSLIERRVYHLNQTITGWALGTEHKGRVITGWKEAETGVEMKQEDRFVTERDTTLIAQMGGKAVEIQYQRKRGGELERFDTVEAGKPVVVLPDEMSEYHAGVLHVFEGWSTSSGSTTAEYPFDQPITPTEDMKLYGVWTQAHPEKTYKIHVAHRFPDEDMAVNDTVSFDVENLVSGQRHPAAGNFDRIKDLPRFYDVSITIRNAQGLLVRTSTNPYEWVTIYNDDLYVEVTCKRKGRVLRFASAAASLPQTGDPSMLGAWMCLLGASAAAMRLRRKK